VELIHYQSLPFSDKARNLPFEWDQNLSSLDHKYKIRMEVYCSENTPAYIDLELILPSKLSMIMRKVLKHLSLD
jgi:hypothetical protein